MTVEILERTLLVLGIIGVGVGICRLYHCLLRVRLRRRRMPLNDGSPTTPVILYFTSPACAPCRTVQRPALRSLMERLGEQLQVVEVDVLRQPELAREWGILSLPATIVLNARGEVRYVNQGVASAEKLLKQLNHL